MKCWSERRDSNSGPPVPQTGALTGLRYAPPKPAARTNTLARLVAQGRVVQAVCSRALSETGPAGAPG